MTMNKSERAEFEAFKLERDMARALRWPEYEKPAPMTLAEITLEQRGEYMAVVRGWFQNAYSGNVTYGCSNGVYHNPDGEKISSQNAGRMYREKSSALRAMRYEMTVTMAMKLAEIDRKIAAAIAEEGGEA